MEGRLQRFGCTLLLVAVLLSAGLGLVAGMVGGGAVAYLYNRPPAAPAGLPTPEPLLPPSGGGAGADLGTQLRQVVARSRPAVVTLLALEHPSLEGEGLPQNLEIPTSSGSGFLIDREGTLVTNAHVVGEAQELAVIFDDGSRGRARVVGTDALFDLAVLELEEVPAGIDPLPWGDSDALQVGDPVLAIGSALGDFRNSVTFGIISGKGRHIPGDDLAPTLLQTDAAINKGNSGGPLLNLRGEVVGINTAIVRGGLLDPTQTAEGLGFAIPSNVARRVVEQLKAEGRLHHPFLGVSYSMISPFFLLNLQEEEGELPPDFPTEGAYVHQVLTDTAAERAGVRAGDVILAIDDKPLDQEHPLVSVLLPNYKPGDTVRLRIWRDGKELELEVTLGERPRDLP